MRILVSSFGPPDVWKLPCRDYFYDLPTRALTYVGVPKNLGGALIWTPNGSLLLEGHPQKDSNSLLGSVTWWPMERSMWLVFLLISQP